MTEEILKQRGWYWKSYGDEYKRFKVSELPQFCGWKILRNLIAECDNALYYEKCKPPTVFGTEL